MIPIMENQKEKQMETETAAVFMFIRGLCRGNLRGIESKRDRE